MSSTILRSRLSSLLSNRLSRRFCTEFAPKEPLAAAAASTSTNTSPTATAAAASRKPWRFLTFSLTAALTGAAASAGYVSYAYSINEIDEKTKAWREAANSGVQVPDDASAVDKLKSMINSSAITVPAKVAEAYLDARKTIEEQVRGYTEPYAENLLPEPYPYDRNKRTLVLDLQETLLYSYWTREKGWQTIKRPGVDAFLEHVAQYYEVVVYSDYAQMYVDPVIERLDPKRCVTYKLGKAATKYQDGVHYRDLSKLNRDPRKIIYLSAHARENTLQPENGAVIKPFKSELDDTALVDFIPFLECLAGSKTTDVREVLASYEGHSIPAEFIRRSKEHQRIMQEKKGIWRR